MPEIVVELLLQYKYLFFFFGMILGGEVVLLPAIYLSLSGLLSAPLIILVGLSATMLSDAVWYLIGRNFPFSRISHLRAVERSQTFFQLLLRIFDRHALPVIFLSNFVYGTRVITQIISGFKRVPFWKYAIANGLGSLSYVLFLFVLGLAVKGSFGSFVGVVDQAKLVFPIFILVVLTVNLWIRRIVRGKWSEWSSRP